MNRPCSELKDLQTFFPSLVCLHCDCLSELLCSLRLLCVLRAQFCLRPLLDNWMARPAVIFGSVVHAAPSQPPFSRLLKSFSVFRCGGFVLLFATFLSNIPGAEEKMCVNTKEAERIFTTCVNPAHVPKYPTPSLPCPSFFSLLF